MKALFLTSVLAVCGACTTASEALDVSWSESKPRQLEYFDPAVLPPLALSNISGELLFGSAQGPRDRFEATVEAVAANLGRPGAAASHDMTHWMVEDLPQNVRISEAFELKVVPAGKALPLSTATQRGRLQPAAAQAELSSLRRRLLLLSGQLAESGYFQTSRNLRDYLLTRRLGTEGYATTNLPSRAVFGAAAALGFWTSRSGPQVLPSDVVAHWHAGKPVAAGPAAGTVGAGTSWGEAALLRNRLLMGQELQAKHARTIGQGKPLIVAARTSTIVTPPAGSDWFVAFGDVAVETYSVARVAADGSDALKMTSVHFQRVAAYNSWDAARTRNVLALLCSSKVRTNIVVDRECGELMASYERLGTPAFRDLEPSFVTPFAVTGTSALLVSEESFAKAGFGSPPNLTRDLARLQ